MAESTAAPITGGFALAPAPVGGRRHHMKKVSAKTIKRTLRKLGMKPKGRVVLRGGDADMGVPAAEETPVAAAGRRRRGGKKTKRRSASKGKLGILGL